ncbi:MAG: helix-turn-helix domain-containing protein [Coriobacteriales bacterium]|jgi:hypothetical protein|nr:helix-turn-helix domain-containing protein [Coriobacteriales bacterium]
MKLNAHIVFDELAEYSPEITAPASTDLDVRGARLYRPGFSFDPAFIYLVLDKDLAAVPDLGQGQSMVLVGPKDSEGARGTAPPPHWKVIRVASGHDPVELFMCMQSVFETYAAWQEDVLKTTVGQGSLQVVFDKAASVLNNAIALVDTSQTVVMRAGDLPDDVSGSIWGDLLHHGYARLENLSKQQRHLFTQELWGTEEPFFLEKVSQYRDARHLIAPLHHEGKPFAMLGMSDLASPITLGQISLVKLLQGLMKHVLLSEIGKQHLADHVGYYADRILQGYLVERGALTYSLELRNWKIADSYQAVYLRAKDTFSVDDSLHSVQTMRVQSLFPSALAFPYEQGVLAVLRDEESPIHSKEFCELERLCESLDLYCGISMVHTGFLQIREAYLQAKAALEFGEGNAKERVLCFQEHYVPYLVGALESTVNVSSLCHPKVLRQWLREGDKGRALVETLHSYLIHGKNANATARAMGLHRNTVIYRLERLSELLGDDLTSTDVNTHLMLLLSCLLVPHLKAARRTS